MLNFISKIASFRRRSWFSLFLHLLPLCFLQYPVSGSDIVKAWAIQGPSGKKCLTEGDIDISPTGKASNSTICDDSFSFIRLDYTINKSAKYPKYRIFQKECEEEFEAGTEPIRGIMSPDEDNKIALSISPASDGYDTVTASLEILLTKDALAPSLWQRWTNTEMEQQTIEFCVRMGLWLPPEAGNMEVNFRETNIVVIFDKKLNDEGNGHVVNNFVLENKSLRGVKVHLQTSDGIATQEEQAPAEGTLDEKNLEL